MFFFVFFETPRLRSKKIVVPGKCMTVRCKKNRVYFQENMVCSSSFMFKEKFVFVSGRKTKRIRVVNLQKFVKKEMQSRLWVVRERFYSKIRQQRHVLC